MAYICTVNLMIKNCFYYTVGQWERHNSQPKAATRHVDPGGKVLVSCLQMEETCYRNWNFRNTDRSFQGRAVALEQQYGKAGGRRQEALPTTITTAVNSYFRDPEPKPPARNQGSESLSSVRSAPLASTSPCPPHCLLHLSFHVLYNITSKRHSSQCQFPGCTSKINTSGKNIWGKAAHNRLPFWKSMSHLLCIAGTLLCLSGPLGSSGKCFSSPISPLHVATQGAAILFSVISCTLGCSLFVQK